MQIVKKQLTAHIKQLIAEQTAIPALVEEEEETPVTKPATPETVAEKQAISVPVQRPEPTLPEPDPDPVIEATTPETAQTALPEPEPAIASFNNIPHPPKTPPAITNLLSTPPRTETALQAPEQQIEVASIPRSPELAKTMDSLAEAMVAMIKTSPETQQPALFEAALEVFSTPRKTTLFNKENKTSDLQALAVPLNFAPQTPETTPSPAQRRQPSRTTKLQKQEK